MYNTFRANYLQGFKVDEFVDADEDNGASFASVEDLDIGAPSPVDMIIKSAYLPSVRTCELKSVHTPGVECFFSAQAHRKPYSLGRSARPWYKWAHGFSCWTIAPKGNFAKTNPSGHRWSKGPGGHASPLPEYQCTRIFKQPPSS
ncbi:hypothetical protein BKA70DRAFT_1229852 [Coprinopsis sp. MPI-PUGE-AT-0042]|nr:hypothetical protein BKA70DRAFT_1229852 [Coprinopsis sp. MPI-PUGE-AT-0042]